MTVQLTRERTRTTARRIARRPLGVGLIGLGIALVANSLMGPLVADFIDYPFSETLWNQMIGLEAFSLAVVAPVSIVAGLLALRGHRAAAALGFGPSAYTVYMFAQYVVGPEYDYYSGAMLFHLGVFVAGGLLAVATWSAMASQDLPTVSRRSERRHALVTFGLAAFLVARYLPMLGGLATGASLPAEFAEDVSMFWSIVLLDLGIALPATIAVGVGFVIGAAWRRRAMYALIGWWALVPPSVAAMALAMAANDDPYADAGQATVFVIGALAFAAFAVHLYRPLFARERR